MSGTLTVERPVTRDEWLEERKTFVGASEIAAVMGLSKWATPRSVWDEKVNGTQKEETLAMRMGRHMEPFILAEGLREAAAKGYEITEARANSKTFRHDEFDYIGSTPDGFGIYNGHRCVLETKFANDYVADNFGQEGSDQLPDEYVVQVVWQMLVTKCRYGFLFACMSNRQIAVYLIDGTDSEAGKETRALASHALSVAHDFWRCVEDRVQPALTGQEPDTQWVKQTYSYEDGSVTNADEALTAKCRELLDVRGALAAGELVKSELENQIKQFMGEAAILETPVGDFTWKADKNGQRSFRVGKGVSDE